MIVAIDYFTKWAKAWATPKITIKKAVIFVKTNILVRFGVPNAIITNNGTQFKSKKFIGFYVEFQINLHFTSVYHP